jgi:predicted RNase H-like HicB family nuclease
MIRYLIVIEQTATGYSAYSPDLPGCIATASTRAKLEREMQKAIEFHIEGLRLSGYPVPEPRSQAAHCEIAA